MGIAEGKYNSIWKCLKLVVYFQSKHIFLVSMSWGFRCAFNNKDIFHNN
jgi:hypothetical protein